MAQPSLRDRLDDAEIPYASIRIVPMAPAERIDSLFANISDQSFMRRYLRFRRPGATCFFTVNLQQRDGSWLLIDRIDALRDAIVRTRRTHPFSIDAIVVLPDHLHAVWTLPAGDADYSTRWALIKARFSRTIAHGETRSASRLRRRERGIWQRRFYEHTIRDGYDLENHIDYIHQNPVKHGWALRTADWPWSSFHHHVRAGLLPVDWGSGPRQSLDAKSEDAIQPTIP
jgi:putative transposase